MSQGPFQVVSLGVANKSVLNVSANTVIKPTPGFVVSVSVVNGGSADGGIYDAAEVADAVSASQIAVISQTEGVYAINFPASTGIVIKPGTGQVIAVSYN